MKKACIKDLFKEWKPKIADPVYLADSHQQSYVVLNLCRILYTIMRNDAVSKKVAASWIKKEHSQWKNIIETAEDWHYGLKMERQREVVEFIKFVISKARE